MRNLPPADASLPDLLRKLFAITLTLVIVVLAVMFSMEVFAIILLLGVLGWGYLMWKTRHLRKMMREVNARHAEAMRRDATQETAVSGEVIEGEVVQVHTSRDAR